MNVVFTLASLGSGGAERVVALLANKMTEQGHQVEIICLKYNDIYYKLHSQVRVTLAMQKTRNRLTEFCWLRKYVCREKPDVVIAFTEGVYCFTIAALLGTGTPVVASERLDPSAMSFTRKVLKRILLPYADWMVVQTQRIKAYFPESIQKKTSIIFNPVLEDVLCDTRFSQSPSKENRIISVARLYPQKNQKMMILAFSKIASRFPDWQLVIFGEGPCRAELESLVREKGLGQRVLLPGRTEHVADELRKSKIFCLSSDYEGMSNSMIEAVCGGLPVISTRVSGTEELVKDGENGLLVDVGDTDGMSKAMESLMQDDERQVVFSCNSRKLAGYFSLEKVVAHWEAVLNKVVSSKNKY